MKGVIPDLDATNVLIALKTCLAIVLSLAIAFQLDWKPSFGVILIIVLQTPLLGATYKKGLLYIAGTLSGAIVGLTMVALFAHDRVAFIVAMALWTGFGIYRLQLSRYPYAWLIFTVTLMLVGFFSVQDPSSAFGIAVMRSSTICVAVVIAFLVHGVLWPIGAGKIFERQLHGFLDGCRGLLALTSRALAGDEPDPDAVRKAETAQINAIAALHGTLDAAAADTERFGRFHAGYEQLLEQLYELLLAIVAVREDLQITRDGQAGKSPDTAPAIIRSNLEMVESELEELMSDLARPRDGTAGPREADAGIDESTEIDTPFAAMLAGSIRDVARQVSKLRATLSHVEDPEQAPAPLPAPPRTPFRVTSVQFRKAAGSSLVVMLLGWFYIETQWPMGLELSIVFASIAIALGALLPLMLVGRQLLASTIIGAAIAAPLYFVIMPGISQYEQLIPWLCVVLIPLLYLIASATPQTKIQYLFSAIFVIALLSLDEEGQSYSFSSFFNTWMGLAGGFAGALAVFGLFSSMVPEREFWKQLRSFFAGCGQSMRDLGKNPPGTPAGAVIVKAGRRQWASQFKQLQMWSSAIDYKRLPRDDRQKIQALIESIKHVALRLNCAEHVQRKPVTTTFKTLRETFHQLYNACADSFSLIANSLAELKPIPDLPDTEHLIREIESKGNAILQSPASDDVSHAEAVHALSVRAHFQSLADAIQDCRDRANALDWKVWNRNYF